MASPGEVPAFNAFVSHLRWIASLLPAEDGWLAVLAVRDTDRLRACLEGRDLPAWETVTLLLGDYERRYGTDGPAREQARELHAQAVTAWDARLDAERYLAGRVAQAESERAEVADRSRQEHMSRDELAWARAEFASAQSRYEEYTVRRRSLAEYRSVYFPAPGAVGERAESMEVGPLGSAPDAVPRPEGTMRRARRLAGSSLSALAFGTAALSMEAELSEERAAAGAAQAAARAQQQAVWTREAQQIAAQLEVLRVQDEGGRAHELLCEAVEGEAARLPLLVRALESGARGSETTVLLWEAASLPPLALADAAQALDGGGYRDHAAGLLRQASGRALKDVATLVAALNEQSELRDGVLRDVLTTRRREDFIALAQMDSLLIPPLLAAARQVSAGCSQDLRYALRLAGLPDVG
ncbi:hypothetical protein [Streptomyces sp. NBC_01358]|uniref:hypothetical protein n=1 Tax=Streptomyces sp. NBC_01358 TaxID=2903837 RepID=UPI002E3087DE|nr:hypothetical protein [Streptomyces sp. NBC_01358]